MQFFADLDPHRKGYITFNDWLLAFQSYDWNAQIMDEFRNILYMNFTSIDSAFNHFYQNKSGMLESTSEFSKEEFNIL